MGVVLFCQPLLQGVEESLGAALQAGTGFEDVLLEASETGVEMLAELVGNFGCKTLTALGGGL